MEVGHSGCPENRDHESARVSAPVLSILDWVAIVAYFSVLLFVAWRVVRRSKCNVQRYPGCKPHPFPAFVGAH